MPSYVRPKSIDDRAAAMQELLTVRSNTRSLHSLLIERLRTVVPFSGFSFSGIDVEGCEMGHGVYLETDLPAAVTDTYTKHRLIEVDPLARIVAPDATIARWEAINSDDLKDDRAQRLVKMMAKYDVAPRTAFTLWSRNRIYGVATFMRDKPFSDQELTTLDCFAGAVHASLAKPVVEAVNQRLGLMKGEVLCLRLASKGLTSEDIASETPFTIETVNTYLKSATKKLKARNRVHAVSEAIRRKIID